jgi:hypothetical protein
MRPPAPYSLPPEAAWCLPPPRLTCSATCCAAEAEILHSVRMRKSTSVWGPMRRARIWLASITPSTPLATACWIRRTEAR